MPGVRLLLTLVAAVVALLAASPAWADTIELKDGGSLDGQILSEKCQDCTGAGAVDCPACAGTGLKAKKPCPGCTGRKQVSCPACAGLGIPGDKVSIRIRAGVVSYDRAQIRRVVWRAVDPKTLLAPAEYYQQALAKLDPKDARAALDLGIWCAANGMAAEARKLFAAATSQDAAMGPLAAPHLAELDKRRESEAVKALLTAVALLEDRGPEAGAAALRAFQKAYAETELGRRAELQRDLVRRQFPKLAEAGAATVEDLLRTAEDRLAVRCPACAGSGREKCPDCGGTADGRCPDCAATGQGPCAVCNGSSRLTCPRCFGTGHTRNDGTGLGYNFERACPDCKGAKEVPCDICAGTGKRPCKRCAGGGRLPGACATCAAGGSTKCRRCGGSGIRGIELFAWGPPPVRQPGIINVGGGAGRARAWQGEYAGGVITVLPADTLYRGTLGAALEAAAGKRLRGLAVALDNRKGQKLLRFRPADRQLRGVTEDHAQVEIVNLPKLLAPKEEVAQIKAIAKQASDRDCLPGASEYVIAAMPEGTDLDALTGIFWMPAADAEPVRLAPIWLADDEVAELRKSLR